MKQGSKTKVLETSYIPAAVCRSVERLFSFRHLRCVASIKQTFTYELGINVKNCAFCMKLINFQNLDFLTVDTRYRTRNFFVSDTDAL